MDMSDAVIVKSTRLKSVVWNDFDRIKKGDTCVAVCRHCKKKLSGSSTSGTSHLRNHLIRCQRRSSHGITQLYAAREKKKEGTLSLTNFNLDQEQKKDEVLNLVNIRFEQDQMKEENINYVNTNFDQRRSRFDLARMIILHGYPLAMVEHVGFKVFVKNLQPLFELVTSERVEADCMEIYMKEKQKVNEVLDKLPGKICLSADMWATVDNAEYLCLTANYIDESWRLNKKILNFIRVDPSHTEDMHSEVIMTCLMDWDIDRKLFSMTFDNGSANDNIVARIRDRLSQNRFLYCEGQLFDVRCAVSVLVVLAQDVLAALSEVVHKVRESIRYVKSSQSVQSKFSDIAQELGIQSQKSLCLDNPLRWDSTYVMLETALEYREAFSALQESDPLYSMCPSDVEWDRTNIINGYLKLFVEVTNVFTRNKLATANVYFPEICDVYLQLNEWCKNSDDYISSLASRMKSKFEEYWERCSLGLAVAAILDPRFKMKLVEYYYKHIYDNSAPNRIDDVFESVKALYNEHSICLASLDQGLAWQVGGSAGCLPSSGRDSRDRLMGFDKFLHETSQSEGSKSDLDKYLEEPLFPRNAEFNILNWWKVHTPRYPILSMMARNVLGIPMSKVVSDSAFNTGARVIDRDWSSLNPVTIQALMCAQDWIRSELES
ncbi:zinc finger BED domain-containing protein RICESLEEPER 1 [Ziziphus jujuba]|uniref:Zinc finger BED domain-containing protein RICESLEEPER 1 n=1 Tax=Ziziphus jujuba TaxID=326968 RepID=A0ABM3IGI6_ZIZJJ|nr:zinc finger BED domain-containing protein RICESLEEPER 1 [Ziziphus jujuba]